MFRVKLDENYKTVFNETKFNHDFQKKRHHTRHHWNLKLFGWKPVKLLHVFCQKKAYEKLNVIQMYFERQLV